MLVIAALEKDVWYRFQITTDDNVTMVLRSIETIAGNEYLQRKRSKQF